MFALWRLVANNRRSRFFYAAEANPLIGDDVSSPYWFVNRFLWSE